VDSAPSRFVARAIAERHGADYHLEVVAGLSRARNAGASRADTDVVLFLDDDAVPTPGWLGAALASLAEAGTVAVTGPCRVLDESGTAETRALVQEWWLHGTVPRVFGPHTDEWRDIALSGRIGGGSNLTFRRDALLAIGGFDERLGRGAPIDACEEHDVLYRLIEAGGTVRYAPGAIVRHPAPPDTAAVKRFSERARAAFLAWLLLSLIASGRRRAVLRWIAGAVRRRRQGRGIVVDEAHGLGAGSLVRSMVAAIGLFFRALARPAPTPGSVDSAQRARGRASDRM
jgi:GT2 family glycosyltransferase